MKLNHKLILKTLKGFYIPACLTDIGIWSDTISCKTIGKNPGVVDIYKKVNEILLKNHYITTLRKN